MALEQRTNGIKVQSEHNRDDDWSTLLLLVGSKRDRAAFERLFHHFAPLIKGFHYSRSHQAMSPEAADELVQEVMFRVWRKAPSFDARKASASTWIYTIMRNCRIDYLRRNSRHLTESDIEVDDIWDETPDSQPFAVLQQRRNERDIAEGLRNLPAEQSHVLEKAYMEGKSHSEISQELGLPLGTVKSRVRLALKKLQGALKRPE
ncbi:sigma-70 family RNA polymerase sigma factor [uncultured Microbulbifer sp.]|uniref:sigma-70 family RNA polymerase sigma factor n=1 Tax=uncultured Microbulbifer sp. TaxID=348147 RepID=UPI0025FFB737|nr:sigma-70 family RNA polymerase sigma factor [uncultured Microbulbifer sp.]